MILFSRQIKVTKKQKQNKNLRQCPDHFRIGSVVVAAKVVVDVVVVFKVALFSRQNVAVKLVHSLTGIRAVLNG